MAFNGSGVFVRLYNWVTDKGNSVKITASRVDAETDGIVAGLNQVVDGTQGFIGAVRGTNGTASAPAFSFTDDTNTGVYRAGADSLGFSVAGTIEASVEAGYFEAKNALKVDGVDVLLPTVHRTLTAGYDSDVEALGTISSGTVTPEVDGAGEENFKTLTNDGAFTLSPPSTSSACCIRIRVINAASAGAITTSGFDAVYGDAYETTNAKEYWFYIDHDGTRSTLTIKEIV